MFISKIDENGYFDNECKEISDFDGCPNGWVISEQPNNVENKYAFWSGAEGWIYLDESPQDRINNQNKNIFISENYKKAKQLLLDTDYVDLPNTAILNKEEILSWRLEIRNIVLNPPDHEIIFPEKPKSVWS